MTFDEKINKIDQLFEASKQDIHGPAEFKAIIKKFTFSKEEMSEHLLYRDDLPYGRKCVFQSSNFEVVVMNWKPFEQSNIHDHANSFGCVYSVSGKADNVLYNENLEEIVSIPLVNTTIAEVPKGIFHAIKNNNENYAVSLHFYAPPMMGMKVIDKKDRTKSYFVKNECGAWNPEPEEILQS